LGILLMVTAALSFRSSLGNGLAAFRPQWWGILGLIGWAYLLGCHCYLPLRKRPEALLGALALCLLIQLAAPFGLGNLLKFPGGTHPLMAAAPHAALVIAGALLGSILRPESPLSTPLQRVRWALGFALGLYAASVLLHQRAGLHEVFIVSKNLATPTWCLRSAAYATLLWTGIYLVVDVAKVRWGVDFLAQAGQNALFAYILAPLVLSLVGLCTGLLHLPGWWALGSNLGLGLARGALSALAFVALAGFLSRKGLQLKL
jgi:predicted acyltransferase